MTLADLMPVRIGHLRRQRPTGKHRENDAVDLLQCKLAGAQLLIKGLRLQLDDKDREHEATIRRIDERHAEMVRGLEAELADAQRRLGIACKANAAADQTQEIDVTALRAIVPVPLHEAREAGRLGPVLDPGRVHGEGAA